MSAGSAVIFLFIGIICAFGLLQLVRLLGALEMMIVLVLVLNVSVERVHGRHLTVLVVLLVVRHGRVVVCVSYWYSDVLRNLQLASLAYLVEGLDRNVRNSAGWAIA